MALPCNLYEWHDPWDSIYIRWTELPFIHQRRLENIDTMWSITLVMISLLRLTAATIVTAEAENESISTARNTTRSFRLRLKVTHGDRKYNWVCQSLSLSMLHLVTCPDTAQYNHTIL